MDALLASPSVCAGTKSMRCKMSDSLVAGFGCDHTIINVVADVVKNVRNVERSGGAVSTWAATGMSGARISGS